MRSWRDWSAEAIHAWQAARKSCLKWYIGRPTDGEAYFLLVGSELGQFGIEGAQTLQLAEGEVLQIIAETKRKLGLANLSGEPRLHFQLIAQY